MSRRRVPQQVVERYYPHLAALPKAESGVVDDNGNQLYPVKEEDREEF